MIFLAYKKGYTICNKCGKIRAYRFQSDYSFVFTLYICVSSGFESSIWTISPWESCCHVLVRRQKKKKTWELKREKFTSHNGTSKHKSFWSKRRREGKLTALFRNTQTLKLKSSLWAGSPGCSGGGAAKESGGVCNLGLDTNTTKNRLNMFPEIPDFFLNISKSSQYVKKYSGICI